MQRKNVRVLEVRRCLDLGEEAIGTDDSGELGSQHLHCDAPVVLDILSEINRCHAARAELPLDAIAV